LVVFPNAALAGWKEAVVDFEKAGAFENYVLAGKKTRENLPLASTKPSHFNRWIKAKLDSRRANQPHILYLVTFSCLFWSFLGFDFAKLKQMKADQEKEKQVMLSKALGVGKKAKSSNIEEESTLDVPLSEEESANPVDEEVEGLIEDQTETTLITRRRVRADRIRSTLTTRPNHCCYGKLEVRPDMGIIDEAHGAKNRNTRTHQAICKARFRSIALASASIIPNTSRDLAGPLNLMYGCAEFLMSTKKHTIFVEQSEYNKLNKELGTSVTQVPRGAEARALLPSLNPVSFSKLCNQEGPYGDVEKALTPILRCFQLHRIRGDEIVGYTGERIWFGVSFLRGFTGFYITTSGRLCSMMQKLIELCKRPRIL
jgi:hypothetical protein